MDISVIVATYNRCDSLKLVLERLSEQRPGAMINYEILIVDNNSSDNTREVVLEYAGRFAGRLRYVYEPRQGKSCALNAGIKLARGELAVFTDDDDIVAENWIESIYNEFHSSNIDAALGRVVRVRNKDISKEQERAILQEDAPIPGELLMGNGCNMIVRRDVLFHVGLFDENLGPGLRSKAGEDTDIVYRLLRHNKRVSYSKDIVLFYRQRTTLKEANQQLGRDWFGVGFLFSKYFIRAGDLHALKRIYWHLKEDFVNLFGFFLEGNLSGAKMCLIKITALISGVARGCLFWPFQKKVLV